MAGNQVHHQEKIDVSVDQRDKESPLNEDSYTEEVGQILSGQIFAKQLLKTKSIEGHSSSKKKSTSFQITSVVDRSGLYHTHEDGDSVDDLDDTCETHTEDVSSDILDQSKNTDIEPEPSSSEETTPSFVTDEIPITKDLTSRMNTSFTQNQTNYQGNDSKGNDMQSRFKVVKIESQEPFTRGRWTCQDYLDPQNEKSVERTEKTDKPVEEVGSGNSSAASSIHYVHGVDDPSKNPLASSGVSDGHAVVEPQPVYPTTSQGQIIPNGGEQYTYSAVSQTGKQGGVSVPAGTEQQVGQNQTYDVNQMIASPSQVVQGQQAPNSEQSSHSQQSGKAQTLVTNGTGVSSQQTGQSQSNLPAQPDYDYNQGVPSQMSSQGVQLQQGPNPDQNTGMPQGQDYIPDGQEYLASNHEYVQQQQGQDFMPTITSQAEFTQPSGQSGVEVSQSSQTPIASQPSMATSQSAVEYSVAQTSTAGSSPALAASDFSGQSPASSQPVTVTVPTSVAPNSNTSPNNDNVQASEMHAPPAAVKEELTNSSLDTLNAAIESKVTHTTHIAKPEGASAIKTSASQTQSATSFLSPPLLEMVTATMGNVTGSVNLSKEEGDERSLLNVFSGASTVAIDNKIEQAMDLVKSHLMFAVREEVEVLKEQIKELLEKNTQLEVENNILKKSATPETLAKLNQATSSQVPPTSTS